MPQIQFTSLQLTVIASVYAIVVGIAICWTVYQLKDKPEIVSKVFADGQSVKIAVVCIIVGGATILTLADRVDGSATVSLLSAVAGYLLGSGVPHKPHDLPANPPNQI